MPDLPSHALATTLVEGGALATPANPDDEETLLSFFSVEGLGRAVKASGFTVERELEILREIAEHPDEPGRVKIAALDAHRDRLLQSLRLSGRLAKILTEQRADANQVTDDGDTTKSLSVVQHTSLEMLRRFADKRTTVVAGLPVETPAPDPVGALPPEDTNHAS